MKSSADKLIISKSLRHSKIHKKSHTKYWRIEWVKRSRSSQDGDRIPYVYILTNKKGSPRKQDDILTIFEKKLRIDYGFYINNQIMKPVLQIYGLVLYNMPQFQRKKKRLL